MHSLTISRDALIRAVVAIWILKGVYLYAIWSERTFSLQALDEGASNLGRAGLGLAVASVGFVLLQTACVLLWWRRGVSTLVTSPLLALGVSFFCLTSVIGYAAAGGVNFWFYWPVFVCPFILVAATSRATDLAFFCMRAYGGVLLVSLALYPMDPVRMTMESGGTDLFQWPRVAGLTAHPNVFGAVAGLVGMCAHVLARSKERLFWMIVAVVSLLASQSKTAIAAFAVVLMADFCLRFVAVGKRKNLQALIVAAVFTLAITSPVWLEGAAQVFAGANATLTGRTDIWTASMTLWEKNPLIGGGPEVFDAHFRRMERLSGAESAHNQALDTLASSGIVGLAGLVFMLIACVIGVRRMADPTRRRLVVCLLVFLGIRCMSESTLKFAGPSIGFVMFFLATTMMFPPRSCEAPSDGGGVDGCVACTFDRQ